MSRKQVIEAAKPAHEWLKEWRRLNSQDSKTSPEMSKKSKSRQLKSPQTHPPDVLVDLPDSAVRSKGVTNAVHQFLEVGDGPLFTFFFLFFFVIDLTKFSGKTDYGGADC